MPSTAIAKSADAMYAKHPDKTLYHYTSLGGLLGIVTSGTLFASEIRYFNDAAELRHAAGLLVRAAAIREQQQLERRPLLRQFSEWVSDQLGQKHTLYVSCFTADGNLLSQWRGYCPVGQGVSVGFEPEQLGLAARQQSFAIGQCVYDADEQWRIARHMLVDIEQLADEIGEDTDPSIPDLSKSFYHVFESVETDILRIAVLLKHPSFHEEQEWRVVSSVIKEPLNQRIEYRQGMSMLLPSMRFKIPAADAAPDVALFGIEHVIVGPTPHPSLSVASIEQFLHQNRATPRSGVSYCGIPYRTV